MKLTTGAGNSYPRARLKGRVRKIHQLVMLAFVGAYPPGKPHINHKDAVKTNNRLDNLEFVSRAESAMHAFRLGLIGQRLGETCQWHRGERHVWAKFTEATVADARRRRAAGGSLSSLAKRYGVSITGLRKAVTRETWAHVK